MKIKIKVQIGVLHKDKEAPDSDFFFLCNNPNDLIKWVMAQKHSFYVEKTHRLPDGFPFLIEYIAETCVEKPRME